MKLILLFLFILPFTKTFAQEISAEDLAANLKKQSMTQLTGIEIPGDVQTEIDTLIEKAKTAYLKKFTGENYNLILHNFDSLLDSIKNNKVEIAGQDGKYTIDLKHFKKATKGICPLYPFC